MPSYGRSWDASGYIEKAWKRLDPPTRDELARRMTEHEGKELRGTDLSNRNNGTKKTTPEFAARIMAVVPGLTIADLGAPSSVVAEMDPTVLEILRELATKVAATTRKQTALQREVTRLQARIQRLEDRPWPGEVPEAGHS